MHRRGRFERAMEPLAVEYTSSTQSDIRIFYSVVQVNLAHAIMLAEQKIIPEQDAAAILRTLAELHETRITGLELRPELEDIHMAVEEFVSKATGEEVGGKLHTAKSRNDQVATAIRLTLRKNLLDVEVAFLELVDAMIALAEKNTDTIMPGYTHLQVAEPTTFAHYLSAYCYAFLRDVGRLEQAYESVNSCPMGACAFAGTSFPINRARVAHLLGFRHVDENTMDAVGSRDFALQTMAALAIAMTNMSRLAEELSLWSSAEFDMIEIPDEFASPSSIMPQKKNPVVAEVARAKTGRVLGNLVGTLTVMKALPQAYNLDLQELTPLLWSSVDDAKDSANVMARLVRALEPKREVMRERAGKSFAVATELADALVRKAGLAFRDAHAVVGRMVARAGKEGRAAGELNIDDLRAASKEIIGKDVGMTLEELREALDLDKCVTARALPGGPAPKTVREQLKSLKRKAKNHSKLVQVRRRAITKVEVNLLKEAKRRGQ
ncbi:MAG: argininosuccinate lyase [Hadesarchaea archaeon]|nr:argininosuccinate lyase [Hadesarchaea archaeon]